MSMNDYRTRNYRDMNDLADRLTAAIERERDNWREKIAAGMEVADAFKK